MPTAMILIGNSDDKLAQTSWSQFIADVERLMYTVTEKRHFSGFSDARAPWQNACWVFDLQVNEVDLGESLAKIARNYKQDSIALVIGETRLVPAAK